MPNNEIDSIIALFSKEQFQEALNAIDDLVVDNPNDALLFNIRGACYAGLDQINLAKENYEKSLALNPGYAKAHYNLAGVLHELDNFDASIKSYQDALNIEPDYAEAHNNLGNVLKEIGHLDQAIASYQKAVDLKPDYIEAYFSLGATFHESGKLEHTVQCYERVLEIRPNFTGMHNNLGNVLRELGRFDDAVLSYEKAISIDPDFVEAGNNLGLTFVDLGENDKAIKCYENVLKIDPNSHYTLNNLGIVFGNINKEGDAALCFEKAILIKPDYTAAHLNHGNLMSNLHLLDQALKSYEIAKKLNPKVEYIAGNILRIQMNLCLWDDFQTNVEALKSHILKGKNAFIPFTCNDIVDDPRIQKLVTELYVKDNFPKSFTLPDINQYPKHHKIRIGYFSGDFREHPVSTLTAGLYENHDRSNFEVYAFSYGPDTNDAMNLRIKYGVDHFHDVQTMSHKDIVLLARSFEIDIAIDLGGMALNARTQVFAMSAAPIQLSYIGFLGTMGASYYDYLLADSITIPKENQQYYSEKIAYLPTYQVNDSKESPPEIFFTREDIGLPENGFVFCCFNSVYKITPSTFASWLKILNNVEGSVLLLNIDLESARENLINEIIKKGLDPSRLIFAKRFERDQYLARYRVVDLFLDTLPYNAATTASDALRMGLPVLTCRGNSFASRMAASVLTAVNLPELITNSQEQYESVAIELANNPEKFKKIKAKLDANLATAPLYDTAKFTENLESVYKVMYRRYHDGLEPDHIYLDNTEY